MSLWPQYTYLALSFLGLGASMAAHGQPRSPMSFWVTLTSSSIAWFLLLKGGFFDVVLK